MSYSFYCSRCKVDHAGECPPAARAVPLGTGGVITAHDWKATQPVVDLSCPYQCSKCGKIQRLTIVAAMLAAVDGKPLNLPAGPCP